MKCSIIDGRIKLFMPDSQGGESVTYNGGLPGDYEDLRLRDKAKLLHSALQRPELSRAHLASLLRTALKKQETKKAQKTYWHAFLTNYVGKNANSNDGAR